MTDSKRRRARRRGGAPERSVVVEDAATGGMGRTVRRRTVTVGTRADDRQTETSGFAKEPEQLPDLSVGWPAERNVRRRAVVVHRRPTIRYLLFVFGHDPVTALRRRAGPCEAPSQGKLPSCRHPDHGGRAPRSASAKARTLYESRAAGAEAAQPGRGQVPAATMNEIRRRERVADGCGSTRPRPLQTLVAGLA